MSEIKGRATFVNQSEQLRADREAGVKDATSGMIKNLDAQLTAFQAKVKERPDDFRVVRTTEYRGGGMLDELLLAMGVLVAGAAWTGRRR
jgi:rhombotail lipoprotein